VYIKKRNEINDAYTRKHFFYFKLMPYWACYPIFKLGYFVTANTSHNMSLIEASLVINKVEINESSTMKKKLNLRLEDEDIW